ncbi:hypothetical protein F5888DRAFT_1887397 [Russula emetica]|nr:hypothetical protein F5888DRAFT_1887397 [Russula emetica]
MNGGSEGPLTVDNYARRSTSEDIRSRCLRELITFKVLPDDVLLEIFGFCAIGDFRLRDKRRTWGWQVLAHVCRRWRNVVFQSPRHLNLRLLCTSKTPARDTLDIWPPLLLIVPDTKKIFIDKSSSVDNIIAALERNDRVCQIQLSYSTSSQLEYVTDSPAMQKPFPELTDLWLDAVEYNRPGTILPDSFLGGTAPRLRSLELNGVTFPGLPKLLLSTTRLVDLRLLDVSRSGHIPHEAMATSLSALTSLESLRLWFRFHSQPRPALESRRLPPPPLTRSILPGLTKIEFKGASEYLEVILARIDAPRLNELYTIFLDQIIFNTPQLFQFISRSPTLRAPEMGSIAFNPSEITVRFSPQTSDYDVLIVTILYTVSGWQLSFLRQIFTSFLPPISTLEDLYINVNPYWQDDDENTLWLELLPAFAAVKNLYLRGESVPRIAPALQELVGGRMTEVLPTLEHIFLEGFQASGPFHEGIEKFVAARRLTSHPVTVSRWDRDMEI